MEQGKLFFNDDLQRIDIRFDNGTNYGGLHCGDCFEIFVNDEWVPTRIEMRNDWYLVDCYGEGQIPFGLVVRI